MMCQRHCRKRFIQTALLVLWVSLVCINPILAAQLEVDELIESIRSQIFAAEKRAKEKPVFGIKEVKLSISYAVEKKGEGGFKALVVTAETSISSHAVQVMEITLIPLKDIRVEKQRTEEMERVAELIDCRERACTVAKLEASLSSSGLRGIPTRGLGSALKAVILNILFAPDSFEIRPEYYGDLDKLGEMLTAPQHQEDRIQIEGHTDSVGSMRYNQLLSERRAEKVEQYLMQRFSLAPQRLIAIGFGQSRPIATNSTPEGRIKNRRIEVVPLGHE